MLEVYLSSTLSYFNSITTSVMVMNELSKISDEIRNSPANKRDSILKSRLEPLQQFQHIISLPFDPRFRVDGILVDKSKWLDSHTVTFCWKNNSIWS